MKEKIILLISLAIVILSPMLSHACDGAGEGDGKHTLYTEGKVIFLKGNICGDSGWNRAIDINGKKVYFGTSFLFVEGHISEPKKESKKSEQKIEKIGW